MCKTKRVREREILCVCVYVCVCVFVCVNVCKCVFGECVSEGKIR